MKRRFAAGKSQTCRASEWQSHCRNESSILVAFERPGYIHPSLCDEGSSSFDRFFVQRHSALTKPR
jgi:hypothetical protein